MATSGTPYMRLRATPPPMKRIPYGRLAAFLVLGTLGIGGLVMFLHIQASNNPLMTRERPPSVAHVPHEFMGLPKLEEKKPELAPLPVPTPMPPTPVGQVVLAPPDTRGEIAALKGLVDEMKRREAELQAQNDKLDKALAALMKSDVPPPPVIEPPPVRLVQPPKVVPRALTPALPAQVVAPKPDPKVLAQKEAWGSSITLLDNSKEYEAKKQTRKGTPLAREKE